MTKKSYFCGIDYDKDVVGAQGKPFSYSIVINCGLINLLGMK